jgi:hypothetical protein
MPNYPKTFLGLMMAPFTYGKIKMEANRLNDNDSKPSEISDKSPVKAGNQHV